MNDVFNNKLRVSVEDGSVVEINVLDIVDSFEFKKTYVIYTIMDDDNSVFASILNEKDDSYSLDTIVDQREIDFIDKEIDRVSGDM